MKHAASHADRSAPRIFVKPPRWWIWTATPLVVPAVLVAALAPMDLIGRVIWVLLAVGMQGLAVATLRNRVIVEGNQLAIRGVFAWRRVALDRLVFVHARRESNAPLWRLKLSDADGNGLPLSLNGYRPHDRARVMDAIGPFLMSGGVARNGPVKQAVDGTLWRPRRKR
ncbi:hypothetical protein ACQPXB_28010 [Amycolatopsis sp. CA-161197]|uniref:hypothetical protein n=1 Tax=Amycolatopsis sp. CA-161197 TaxID=3239922 RepID=UPI003D93E81B